MPGPGALFRAGNRVVFTNRPFRYNSRDGELDFAPPPLSIDENGVVSIAEGGFNADLDAPFLDVVFGVDDGSGDFNETPPHVFVNFGGGGDGEDGYGFPPFE